MQRGHLHQRRPPAGVCDGCAGGDPQRERLRHRRPMPRAFSGRLRTAGRFYHSLELHQAHRPGHRAGGGEARRLPGAERKAGSATVNGRPGAILFPAPEFFCVFWEIMLAITRSILYNDSAWALTRDISKPHTRGSAAPVSGRTGCRDDRGGGKTKGEIVKWLSYL